MVRFRLPLVLLAALTLLPAVLELLAGVLVRDPALAAACLWNNPALADFRLCNNTSSRVGIALGYKDADGWTTEATNARRWRKEQFSPEKVEARRRAIQERGRTM